MMYQRETLSVFLKMLSQKDTHLAELSRIKWVCAVFVNLEAHTEDKLPDGHRSHNVILLVRESEHPI